MPGQGSPSLHRQLDLLSAAAARGREEGGEGPCHFPLAGGALRGPLTLSAAQNRALKPRPGRTQLCMQRIQASPSDPGVVGELRAHPLLSREALLLPALPLRVPDMGENWHRGSIPSPPPAAGLCLHPAFQGFPPVLFLWVPENLQELQRPRQAQAMLRLSGSPRPRSRWGAQHPAKVPLLPSAPVTSRAACLVPN